MSVCKKKPIDLDAVFNLVSFIPISSCCRCVKVGELVNDTSCDLLLLHIPLYSIIIV